MVVMICGVRENANTIGQMVQKNVHSAEDN